MSKKRVHELAKEYGLENKDAIRLLQQAGISVKTHSSSVYEDEARAVLEKDAEPKEKTVAAPKRPGLRIVKKKDIAEVGVEGDAEATDITAEAVEHEHAAAMEADSSRPAMDTAPIEADEHVHEPTPEVEADDGDVEEHVVATTAELEPEQVGEVAPEAQAAPEASGDAEPRRAAKPSPNQAQVVRMIDRSKLLERVPSNRLGGGSAGEREGGGGPAQAGRKFGGVTEFQVVNDPFGRGREMVAVGRDKKGKVAARKTTTRSPDKRARQSVRERAMFPSRLKRKKVAKKGGRASELTQPKASKRVVRMKETISLNELAHELGVKATEIIRKLMGLGMMVNMNAQLDFETAQLVAADYDYTITSVAFDEGDAITEMDLADQETLDNLVPRSPVVTIMGHVDHGKTSLLDAVRKTKVAAGEAGGITQHIGAYSVTVKDRGSITFLDTPGHAAFTEMRARGANVTDIVILVVAADDGVMPQTEEAIRHAQAAEVPIIVAINKIDRPEANPDRVMQELTKFNLMSEDWGGETLFVRTSATKGTGLDELLDAILLQAEVLELKASEDVMARGVVLEAQLDKGRGPVATILVQHGVLHVGDAVVVGEFAGRVRAMVNDTGKEVKEARPSDAVEIIGLEGVPNAGDGFNAVESPEVAREVATHRLEQRRAKEGATGTKMSLEDLMKRMTGGGASELNLVLKGDVQGSVEAVKAALEKLSTEEVAVRILHSGVGAIKESDIMLATASGGIVLGFNVRPDTKARSVAAQEGVEIRTYNIIYEMIDDVKKAMEGLLTPDSREKILGRAEVRETFKISKVGTIAGCRVVEGKAQRSARARLLRDSVQVFDGKLSSLKRFKDDAREVDSGQECGIAFEGYQDLKVGDVIEFYEIEQISRTLGSAAPTKRTPGGSVEAHA